MTTTMTPFHRTDNDASKFRDYTENNQYNWRVRKTYYDMHTYQTVEFVKEQTRKWCQFNKAELTIAEVVDLMSNLLDESDPDVDIPNAVHAFQTAERIRQVHPDNDWFQLTGLIHDIGKVMSVWGEPQWSVVGDTFPVGCRPSDHIVFGTDSFTNNQDFTHPVYSTKLGIYKENCGLSNVMMSWGHDEYLYRVLRNHRECSLPEEAMATIRWHSFYPWHVSGDYMHLCDDHDLDLLKWIKEFNQFDLYSKADPVPDPEPLIPYYQALIDKYIPGKVKW